jgi:gas vesicle protein
MNTPQREYVERSAPRGPGFGVGLLTGACLGAGLAILLAPRLASELRARLTDSAKDVRARASDRARQATARVSAAVDGISRQGQTIRDDVAQTVARGARELERVAMAAQTDRR